MSTHEKLTIHLVDGRRPHEFTNPQSAIWTDGILIVRAESGDTWSYPVRNVAYTKMTLEDNRDIL